MAGYRQSRLTKSYLRTPSTGLDLRVTIPDRLRQFASADPHKVAFVFREIDRARDTLTRRDVVEKAELLARHFVKLGIRRGDKVATLISTGRNWVLVQFGLYMAGATAINSPAFHPAGVKEIAQTSGCVGTIMEDIPTTADGDDECGSEIQTRTVTVCLFNSKQDRNVTFDLYHMTSEDTLTEVVLPICDANDEAVMVTTSGSGGVSKFVVHTHTALIVGSQAAVIFSGLGENDVILIDRPMSWIGGYPTVFIGNGLTLIYTSVKVDDDRDNDFYVSVLSTESPSTALLMEYRLPYLLGIPDLQSRSPIIPVFLTGGQKVSSNAVQSMLSLCARVVVGYGSSECLHFTGTTIETSEGFEDGTAGYFTPNCEAKLIDADGQVVDIETEGELCFRGPAVAKEIMFPDCTRKSLTDEEGWYHTGDIGLLHPDGLLVIKGRTTEMIKRATVKMFPSVVEKMIRENLEVENVIVVGIPDERLHQQVCACIILKPETALTVEEIRQQAEDVFKPSLAPDGLGLMPGYFLIMETYPKTSTDKYDRRTLAKMAENILNGDTKIL